MGPNLHPLIVHTPIGLLSLYALLELVPFKKIRALPYWFYVKAVMVIAGAGGSYGALLSGLAIEEQFASPLLTVHKQFAIATIVIFTILAAAYLNQWIENAYGMKIQQSRMATLWKIKLRVAQFILKPFIAGSLALFGLIALTITGSLGGALVYGPDIDPVVRIIYDLLVKQ